MVVVVIIAAVLVLGFLFIWFSDFGKNLQSKTDAQLYVRYDRWRTHRMKCEFLSDAHTAAGHEIEQMEEEFSRRGYDLNKLSQEHINAQMENRPIDFSKCRIASGG